MSEYRSRISPALNRVPRVLEKLMYYVVILSSALACLNAVPCWRLDGCLTVQALADQLRWAWPLSLGQRQKKRAVQWATHLGTGLLVLNLGLGLLDLIL